MVDIFELKTILVIFNKLKLGQKFLISENPHFMKLQEKHDLGVQMFVCV